MRLRNTVAMVPATVGIQHRRRFPHQGFPHHGILDKPFKQVSNCYQKIAAEADVHFLKLPRHHDFLK